MTEGEGAPMRQRLFEMFKRLTDAANDAVIVTDAEGRIAYWNPAAERILGFSRSEASGRAAHLLIAPERHRSRFEEAFTRPGIEGQGGEGGTTIQLEALTADGEEIPVELSLSAETLHNGWHALGILRDITARKRTEAALHSAKERAERLFRVVPSAVVTVDGEDRVTSANDNAMAMLGYTSEELIGQPCSLFDLERDGEASGLLDETMEMATTGRKCRLRTKSGEVLTVLKNADILRDDLGRVTGGVESYVDISEQVRTLKQLEEARLAAVESTRTKSEFLANMSHEVRTPMNAIIGMTGLLLDTELSEEQADYVETIRRGGENLLGIINDILDFSKIESGKLTLEAQRFDLRECIEDALDLVAPQAAEKGLDLIYEARPGTPVWVEGDDTRLRQILVNLVSNGVKFTGRGDVSVTVGAESSEGDEVELAFSVRDTGIGIPADRMDRLFQSFSQVDASTTRHYGGTGLGLAICDHLCQLMGGAIHCESEVGKGSTFRFTVRMAKADGPVPDHVEIPDPMLQGKRILIVDDNHRTCEVLSRLVATWGMAPRAIHSEEDALECLRFGESFDIALIDTTMQSENGADLARGVRMMRPAEQLPILLLNPLGPHDPEGANAEKHPAVSGCVPKPVKPARLYEALTVVLSGAGKPVKVAPEPQPASRISERSSRLRILVAEDNPVNQMVASRLLDRLGCRADLVSNGQEVLEALKRQHYDVILMDVQMPWMDGLQATREVRKQKWAGGQPHIIAVTANAMKGDRETCLESGMDDYIAKPLRIERLAEALEEAGLKDPIEVPAVAPDVPADVLVDAPTQAPPPPARDPLAIDREHLEELLGEEVGPNEILQELVGLFADSTPDIVTELGQAIEEGNSDEARQHAHSLKGSAATLGAKSLSELCKQLEFMCRDGNLDDAPALFRKVEKGLIVATTELQAICGG